MPNQILTQWQVQQHVLSVQLADLRPVRLMLGALNALRSIHIDAVCGATRKQSRESCAADWQQVGTVAPSWHTAPCSLGVRTSCFTLDAAVVCRNFVVFA